MQQFKGRVVVPGTCTAEALVSHGGFNTLASYQMAMMFGDKQVKCGDQNNPDIYRKPMILLPRSSRRGLMASMRPLVVGPAEPITWPGRSGVGPT